MPKLILGPEEVLCRGKFIEMWRTPFTDRDSGKKGYWEFVRRKTLGRIVAVVGLTPDRQIILTKNFRVPLGGYILEYCAGLADRRNETEVELARRELLEETGYVCDQFTLLMSGPFNAGLNADELVVYFGTNARRESEPQLEPAEDIEVVLIPAKDLAKFLANPPPGLSIDLKLWALLPFLSSTFSIP